MKVWLLKEDVNKYKYFDGYEIEQALNVSFRGSCIKDKWVPPTIKPLYKKRKIADASRFSSGAPILNDNAVESLQEFLCGKAELLEASFNNTKYYVINVINIIDALDYEKSDFRRHSTGEIIGCNKYFFKSELLEAQHIFKIPFENSIDIFVSNDFKNRVEEMGLKGFIFVEVWNSDKNTSTDKLDFKIEQSEPIQTEFKTIDLIEKASKETIKEEYQEISEEEAKNLKVKIIENLQDRVVQHVIETSKNKGIIDSINLEYFFDGQCTDIGVRINNLINPTDDEYEESYYQLLTEPTISYNFDSLFHHYVKSYLNEEGTSIFFEVLQEIVSKLNEKLMDTKWENIAEVTKEFSIDIPEMYD